MQLATESPTDLELAAELFGKENLINPEIAKSHLSALPMSLFCNDLHKNDNIQGWEVDFCKSSQLQTDVGVCIGKGSSFIFEDDRIEIETHDHNVGKDLRNAEHVFVLSVADKINSKDPLASKVGVLENVRNICLLPLHF